MAMKRATRKKLILLGVVLSCIASVGILWTVREARTRQGLERDLREGLAAYEAKRYEEAVPHLSRYVSRHRDDPEVLLAFADARRLVPAEDGTNSNLRHALAVTRLALDLRPDSVRGRVMLMEITALLHQLTEANEAAGRVLAQDPTNLEAHWIQLKSAELTGRNDERIRAARRMAEAFPTALTVQFEAINQMVQAGIEIDQLRAFVEERRAGVQREIASELLAAQLEGYSASAAATADERDLHNRGFASHLTAALALHPSEVDEALYLIRALDTTPEAVPDVSADALVARYLDDPDLARQLTPFVVKRAWQRGDQTSLERTAANHQDASTLGDLSLGWLTLGLPTERRFKEELQARSTTTARAWARIAEAADRVQAGDFGKAREFVAPLRMGADADTSAMASFIDAISLRALGEVGLAEQVLGEVARDPAWVRARVQLRDLALQRGDHLAVFVLAQQDRLPGTELLMLEAAVSLDESGYQWPVGMANGRVRADRALMNLRDDPALLALHARAELAAGNSDRALQVAAQLADMPNDRGDAHVLRLADRLAEADGALAATLRERWATAASDPIDSLIEVIQRSDLTATELRDRIEQATVGGPPELRLRGGLLLAGMLDQMGDPSAANEFVRLAGQNPTNAVLQIAALKSDAIWEDLSSVAPIIARLRNLTGEDGVSWRVFQHRLDLLRDDSEATAARVINELSSVLRLAPNDLLALQLMAEAMTRVGDLDRAANYASLAADAAPGDLAVALDAIEARVRAGQTEEATALLRGKVSTPDDPIASHLRLASLFAMLGLGDQALAEWTWLATVEDPDIRARAAFELTRLGHTEEAGNLVTELASRNDLSLRARTWTADALAGLGRKPEGLDLLSQIPEPFDAGERAVTIADYLARHATTPEDLQELERFVRTTDRAEAWLAAVRRYMGEGRLEDARRVVLDARSAVDDPSKLAAFERALDPVMELDPNAFIAIAQANLLTINTDWSPELAAQLDLVIAGQKTLAELVEDLKAFVQERPPVLLGWMLLSQAQATLGDADAARNTARAMLGAIQSDPAAASYAVGLFRRLRMANDGLLAAREYAERIGTPTLESGRNIAQFALAANRGEEAWDAIAPWLPELSAVQDMNLYARAALSVGRTAEAAQVVWPRDPADQDWTHEAVQMAALIRDPTARQGWLVSAAGRVLPADDRGRFLLANGWYQLALDTGDAGALRSCLETIEPDAAEPGIEAALSLIQGSCLSQLGENDGAIRSYRRVLELTPEDVNALNNLAYLLMDTGDAAEALVLAQRAVGLMRGTKAPPSALVEYLDTLGTAQLKNNRLDEALATFNEALASSPDYGIALIGLGETLVALGRSEEAARALARFDRLDARDRSVPAERVRNLRDALD